MPEAFKQEFYDKQKREQWLTKIKMAGIINIIVILLLGWFVVKLIIDPPYRVKVYDKTKATITKIDTEVKKIVNFKFF